MPPMDAAEAKRVYDLWGSSELYYRFWNMYHKGEVVAFVQMADLRPGESVLDLGTGVGWVALEAKRRVQHGRVVGVDASPVSLESARAACAVALGSDAGTEQGSITFVESDFSDIAKLRASLGTPTPSFDVITCCAALHHIPGGLPVQSLVLKDWSTLLVPGGRMVVDWLENPEYVKAAYIHCWPYGRAITDEPNPYPFSATITSLDQWDNCESLFRGALGLLQLPIERLDRVYHDATKDWSGEVMLEARRQWADGLRSGTLHHTYLTEYRRVHASKLPELFVERVRQDFAQTRIAEYKMRGWMSCHSNVAVRAVIKRE